MYDDDNDDLSEWSEGKFAEEAKRRGYVRRVELLAELLAQFTTAVAVAHARKTVSAVGSTHGHRGKIGSLPPAAHRA